MPRPYRHTMSTPCRKIYWYSDRIHKVQPYSSSGKNHLALHITNVYKIGSLKEHLRTNEPKHSILCSLTLPHAFLKTKRLGALFLSASLLVVGVLVCRLPFLLIYVRQIRAIVAIEGCITSPGRWKIMLLRRLPLLESARPSAPRLPNFFFLARPLGFPMVLACVFCVVRAAACAVVVLLCTQRKKKSPHGAEQQNANISRTRFFPAKPKITTWGLMRGIVCRTLL